MPYNYKSLNEIDTETFDYLSFVLPDPIEEMNISDINFFLTQLESYYIGIDTEEEMV